METLNKCVAREVDRRFYKTIVSQQNDSLRAQRSESSNNNVDTSDQSLFSLEFSINNYLLQP